MQENSSAAGVLPWTPLRELTALSQTPLLVGMGLAAPPQNPDPAGGAYSAPQTL